MIPDYTLVVGVDEKHLEQLSYTWKTWRTFKYTLLQQPMIVFYDESVTGKQIEDVIDHPNLQIVRWPPKDTVYEGTVGNKWTDPQRYKMLAGYVHVPAIYVKTPYWLKIDTDSIATGQPVWIRSAWFEYSPAIISQPWGYTKPPMQMVELDKWANKHYNAFPDRFNKEGSLNMFPKEGENKLKHPRIISWCSFYATNFTQWISKIANMTCGIYKLPVHSQDGYAWYMARRMRYYVECPNMKKLGWEHHNRLSGIKQRVEELLYA